MAEEKKKGKHRTGRVLVILLGIVAIILVATAYLLPFLLKEYIEKHSVEPGLCS